MTDSEARNKALVLDAFDTLFNKRDYAGAQEFWSPTYIQHSAHIPPGREGLFGLVKALPKELRYENALTIADGEFVMLHGRFSGIGQPVNWIVVDIVRVENGRLAEHWDVIQDEATRESSKSGLPMFGADFPHEFHKTTPTPAACALASDVAGLRGVSRQPYGHCAPPILRARPSGLP